MTKPKFQYDPELDLLVNTSDPNISVKEVGLRRNGVLYWVLYWGSLRIGFATSDKKFHSIPYTYNEDGTVIFNVGDIGCSISDSMRRPHLSNLYRFKDKLELETAMGLIIDALDGFTSDPRVLVKNEGMGKGKFTDELLARVANGELLK